MSHLQETTKWFRTMRVGKTKRDHARRVAEKNVANKAARADWNNEKTMVRSNEPNSFPYHTCNGKKARALQKAASRAKRGRK